MKKFLSISARTILVVLLIIVMLAGAAIYALQWSEVQSSLTNRVARQLSEKLGAQVSVGAVKISWFNDVTLEDVAINDLEGRDMIYLREVFVDFGSSVSFDKEKIINFDNSLDYVILNEPSVKLHKEANGELNMDRWLRKIADLNKKEGGGEKKSSPIFRIDEAIVENGHFELNDSRKERFPAEVFDYYNFKLENIHGKLKDFYLQGDTIQFAASQVKGKELRSDLTIHYINTDFFYSRDQMLMNNLDAKINNSYLRNFLGFYYDGPSAFNNFNDEVLMRASLRNCKIDAQDMGRFSPTMYQYKDEYTLDADLSGKVVDLTLRNVALNFGKGSTINGFMHFEGLPVVSETNYDFELDASKILANDAKTYAGQKYYDAYVKKFGEVNFSGVFQGFWDDFYTNASVNSSTMGFAEGKLKFKLDENGKPYYNGDMVTENLNLAEITNNKSLLENISFNGQIAGEGSTIGDAAVQVDGFVQKIDFRGYEYKNITVNGVLSKSIFDGFMHVEDNNLVANLNGSIDFNKERNEFKINGEVDKANLAQLGYLEQEYQLKTLFDFDFDGNEIDDWLGIARFSNTSLEGGERNLVVDDLNFLSQIEGKNRVLGIKSEFVDGTVKGPFVPTQLTADLAVLVKEYLLFFNENQQKRDDYYRIKVENDSSVFYSADYQFKIKDSDNLLAFLIPNLNVSKNSKLEGRFKTSNTVLFTCFAEFDTIRYDGNEFYGNYLDFYSSKKDLSPDVLISLILDSRSQQYSNDIETEYLQVNGSWGSGREIVFDASIVQPEFDNSAQAFGSVTFDQDGYDLKINEGNSLIRLLDNDWEFNPNNYVEFKDGEIWFNDFEIRNNDQSLAINGIIGNAADRQVFLNIQDFDLKTLKPIYNVDIAGVANGSANLSNLRSSPIIVSNLFIDNLAYQSIDVGDLNSEVRWDKAQELMTTTSKIQREGEEVFAIDGIYDPKLRYDPLKLKAQLRQTNMRLFQPFTGGIFSVLEGSAYGDIEITGSPTDPMLAGKVQISDGELKLKATGTHLYFDDTIFLNEEGFIAGPKGITVRDAKVNGTTARIEGGVFNGGGGNFMLGMHAYINNANGFKLLDLNSRESEVFYGAAYATGDLHLTGSFEDVLVTANLTSRPNTKVTIPLDGSTSVDIDEEAIPFSPRNEVVEVVESKKETTTVSKSRNLSTSGLRMLFNLTLTQDAECEIIFDRKNNDQLNAFGEGRLTIEYDTRGDFTMTGPYTVRRGKYDFSFQNLASLRKFQIIDGSRLTWSGDPYNAQLNMQAGYTTTFPLRDIPNIDIPDESTEAGNRYPLDVIINIQGELENPIISYEIDFDQEQVPTNFQTEVLAFEQRLKSDEQLLSRNVSSLLAFNQIFREGNALEMINQQFLIDNLNNMLSNQIGNLANKLDPNLELGVLLGDIGENVLNNFQVNFSYKFLNDRLKLSGNSRITNGNLIDNGISTSINQGMLAVGAEVEYILSEDGMWKLRGYSRSVPNVNILNAAATGNVVVSGVNVLFSKNFNTLFPPVRKVEIKKAPNRVPVGVGRKEDPELSLNVQ